MRSIIVRTLLKAFSKVVPFSGVLAVQGWPVDFRFNADPVPLKLVTIGRLCFELVWDCVYQIEVQKECSLCCSYRLVSTGRPCIAKTPENVTTFENAFNSLRTTMDPISLI